MTNPEIIEETKSTEVATQSAAPSPVPYVNVNALLDALGATLVKQVTRPVLQQIENVPFAVHFETAAIESKIAEEGRGGKAKMADARVCDVINVATGSKQLLIMNTVLEGELSRSFPNLSYVNKTFLLRSFFPKDAEGKPRRYRNYEIIQIKVPGLGDEPATGDGIEGVAVVSDGSDPVNRKGDKPKG